MATNFFYRLTFKISSKKVANVNKNENWANLNAKKLFAPFCSTFNEISDTVH